MLRSVKIPRCRICERAMAMTTTVARRGAVLLASLHLVISISGASGWTQQPSFWAARCHPSSTLILAAAEASEAGSEAEAATSSFLEALSASLGPERSFLKLTLSANAAQNDEDAGAASILDGVPLHRLKNVYGRVVALKAADTASSKGKSETGAVLQLLLRYQHRDRT